MYSITYKKRILGNYDWKDGINLSIFDVDKIYNVDKNVLDDLLEELNSKNIVSVNTNHGVKLLYKETHLVQLNELMKK